MEARILDWLMKIVIDEVLMDDGVGDKMGEERIPETK